MVIINCIDFSRNYCFCRNINSYCPQIRNYWYHLYITILYVPPNTTFRDIALYNTHAECASFKNNARSQLVFKS